MIYDPSPELVELLTVLLDGDITPADNRRLVEIISGDSKARAFYREMVKAHALMVWHLRPVGAPVEDLSEVEPLVEDVPVYRPSYGFFRGVSHGIMGNFSHELAISLLVAALVMSSALFFAWIYKISPYRQIGALPSVSHHTEEKTEMVFVGRITAANDCNWENPDNEIYVGASVPLGREYALASGLMEITYNSGARVILEGPCTYKVESSAGGFLERGKLTARIIHQGPVVSAAGAKPQAVFTVKTPTAIVTDLGTEFGVEVAENGDTTSYVFQGVVVVKANVIDGDRVILHENGAIRVSRVRETHHDSTATELVRFTHPTTPPKFVRLIHQLPKFIDLLDIVAGGNGLGNNRERGIDPGSGMEDPIFVPHYRGGEPEYRPVSWHRMIDGVFVPDGGPGPVQLNSVGDVYDGFPETSGETFGSIWSRAADIESKRVTTAQPWVYSIIEEKRFMPKGRGLLGLYANGGITFDLDAIRGTRPARFRATVGLADGPRKDPEAVGMADVWVFVDGRLKFSRKNIRVRDGVFPVDVELSPRDRFLTLVATDGGNGVSWDSVVFGDPVIVVTAGRDNVPQLEDGKEADRK